MAERDPTRGVFGISVAAELSGLHPQTLRQYEQRGLLEPSRTVGGTRRYSEDDLASLQRITALLGAGLNLAGIKQVLVLEAENRVLQAQVDELRAADRRRRGGPVSGAERPRAG